jgi:hypothetical protein
MRRRGDVGTRQLLAQHQQFPSLTPTNVEAAPPTRQADELQAEQPCRSRPAVMPGQRPSRLACSRASHLGAHPRFILDDPKN